MFLSEWRAFPSTPCLVGKKNLMAACDSMLLKSRASLTYFRAFLPGRAKDLLAPGSCVYLCCFLNRFFIFILNVFYIMLTKSAELL